MLWRLTARSRSGAQAGARALSQAPQRPGAKRSVASSGLLGWGSTLELIPFPLLARSRDFSTRTTPPTAPGNERVTEGVRLAEKGLIKEAEAVFRSVVAAHPQNGDAWMNLGSVCLDLTRAAGVTYDEQTAHAEQAARHFATALTCQAHPPHPLTAFLYGRTLVELGDFDRGHGALRDFIKRPQSRDFAAERKEALLLLGQRQWDLTAEQSRLYAEGFEGFKALGGDRVLTDETLRAGVRENLASLDALLAQVPEHWPSWFLSGLMARKLGLSVRDSGARFARAFDLHPDHPDVARELAYAYIQLGNGPDALRVAGVAAGNDPHDPGLAANYALALLINGRVEEAERIASDVLSQHPDDSITGALHKLIKDVLEGRRCCPDRWPDPPRDDDH